MTLAVSKAYWYCNKNAQLLKMAPGQGHVPLDRAGLALATELAQDRVEPRRQSSVVLRDGSVCSILRLTEPEQSPSKI